MGQACDSHRGSVHVFLENNPVGKTLPTTNMSCEKLGWLKSLVMRVVLSLVRSFVDISEAPLESKVAVVG